MFENSIRKWIHSEYSFAQTNKAICKIGHICFLDNTIGHIWYTEMQFLLINWNKKWKNPNPFHSKFLRFAVFLSFYRFRSYFGHFLDFKGIIFRFFWGFCSFYKFQGYFGLFKGLEDILVIFRFYEYFGQFFNFRGYFDNFKVLGVFLVSFRFHEVFRLFLSFGGILVIL